MCDKTTKAALRYGHLTIFNFKMVPWLRWDHPHLTSTNNMLLVDAGLITKYDSDIVRIVTHIVLFGMATHSASRGESDKVQIRTRQSFWFQKKEMIRRVAGLDKPYWVFWNKL